MNQKIKIIPTIFARSKREFDEKFSKLIDISNELQIDFMDGHFVRNKSIKLSDVPNLKHYKNNFEAHLMVQNPETWIKRLKNKGFKKVIFHYESLRDDKKIIDLINKVQKLDMKVFLAINPGTHEDKILKFLNKIDGIMIMGVHPGMEKQSLIYKTFYKIENIRKENSKIPIQIDGGVSLFNAKKLVEFGAIILNSGSFISRAENPEEALEELKNLL